MKYILTTTSRQKNAKRHIFKRFETLEECEKFAGRYIDGKYDLDIYTSNWYIWDEEKEGMPLMDSDICLNCPLNDLFL